jgi:hypothetical protein
MLSRRSLLLTAAGAASVPIMAAAAQGQKMLRIAMTAADLPSTHGIPNNGFEGYRVTGAKTRAGFEILRASTRVWSIQPACDRPG